MNETKIEWCDKTWNPITGCTKCSPGCVNCYAFKIAYTRLAGRFGYPADDPFRPIPIGSRHFVTNVLMPKCRFSSNRSTRIIIYSMA